MSDPKLNLRNIVLFYLAKFYESEGTMTLAELQADITQINDLMNMVNKLFNSPVDNSIITFIQLADKDPLVQNIILLILNQLNPSPTPAPTPVPSPTPIPAPTRDI